MTERQPFADLVKLWDREQAFRAGNSSGKTVAQMAVMFGEKAAEMVSGVPICAVYETGEYCEGYCAECDAIAAGRAQDRADSERELRDFAGGTSDAG